MTVPTPGSPAPVSAPPAAPALEMQPPPPPRLGQLSGDRICTRCSFNLHGQTIIREPHYGLVVVLCPECGTPAALQEYPLPGRWLGKFTGVMVLFWLGALLLLTIITVGATIGIATEVHQATVRPLARLIAMEHKAHQDQAGGTGTQTYYYYERSPELSWIDPNWAAQVDRSTILHAADHTLDPRLGLLVLAKNVVWPLIFGVFWAVALLHVQRRRLWIAPVVLGGIAAAVYLLDLGGSGSTVWISAQDVAGNWTGAWLPCIVMASLVLPLFVGTYFGRPLARLIVRALLPPRLRIPFAAVWTTDGLPPPPPRSREQL